MSEPLFPGEGNSISIARQSSLSEQSRCESKPRDLPLAEADLRELNPVCLTVPIAHCMIYVEHFYRLHSPELVCMRAS